MQPIFLQILFFGEKRWTGILQKEVNGGVPPRGEPADIWRQAPAWPDR
jgi:hypothetical protein